MTLASIPVNVTITHIAGDALLTRCVACHGLEITHNLSCWRPEAGAAFFLFDSCNECRSSFRKNYSPRTKDKAISVVTREGLKTGVEHMESEGRPFAAIAEIVDEMKQRLNAMNEVLAAEKLRDKLDGLLEKAAGQHEDRITRMAMYLHKERMPVYLPTVDWQPAVPCELCISHARELYKMATGVPAP